MKLYLAGPMSGKANYNFTKFDDVEEKLLSGSIYVPNFDSESVVINPNEDERGLTNEEISIKPYQYYLRKSVARLVNEADAVLLIDDWWNSRGATLEAHIAFFLELPIYYYDGRHVRVATDDLPVTTLAHDIVLGKRRFDYGHPLDNFQSIANRWNNTLQRHNSITDVAFAMLDTKMAREQNAPKRDNRIDIVGYVYALDEALRELGISS